MKNTTLSVILVLLTAVLQAQDINWQQKYQSAKAFYTEGKYALAMEAFKPLIEETPGNYFANYSSFYYALSAYNSSYLPLSKNMFLQIKSRYSSWSKIDEVNYWLGLLYLEEKNYYQALNVLGEVKSPKFQDDIESLKLNYFSEIEELSELESLYQSNPNDKQIGFVLSSRISQETLVNQDRGLLRELIKKFDFDPSQFNMSMVNKTVKKDIYKVAVLLPFMTSDLEPTLSRKVNQFVLDIYQGIKLAADTLKEDGVTLDLYAYDTKRSKRVTQSIIEKEELKGMDLIIGPLYPEPIKIANEFSYKNKINIINPLTTNSDVIGNNPFSFMFFPSNESIGKNTAEYVRNIIKKKPGIIIYGDAPADSIMAFAYKERLEADSFNIITKKIRKGNTQSIMDMLLIPDTRLRNASSEDAKQRYDIKLDSVGHIFVASNDDLIASKVLSAVEIRGDSIVVIGSSDWLNLSAIKYDTYSKLGCVLYAPNYNNLDTEEYEVFRNSYISKHHEVPTSYAEIGFELMHLIGYGLKEHGKYFQIGWRERGWVDGHLTAGFDYSNSNDNQVLPILIFENGDMLMKLEDKYDQK